MAAPMSAEAEAWTADSDDEDGFGNSNHSNGPEPAEPRFDDHPDDEDVPPYMTAGGYLPRQGIYITKPVPPAPPSSPAASHSVPNSALSHPSASEIPHTSRPRASSKSSSLFELIDDRDTSELHEDWDDLNKADISDAVTLSEGDRATSQAYFGSEYKPKRSIPRKVNNNQPLIVQPAAQRISTAAGYWLPGSYSPTMDSDNENHGEDWQQAGENADARDLAGIGVHGRLDVTVGEPRKENEGTQNQYISYLVTTDVSRGHWILPNASY